MSEQTIGKYCLVKKLGSGGMGEVWLANTPHGHPVAIKLLGSGLHASARQRLRFFQEAKTLASLQHRNICRIYEVVEHEQRPAIVMEYEDGVTLSSLMSFMLFSPTQQGFTRTTQDSTDITSLVETIQRTEEAPQASGARRDAVTVPGRLALQQSLALVKRLAEAVHYAHERGILHRDIKPSNIIIRRDAEPVLVDFGVAKFKQSDEPQGLTINGEFFGTIEYAAPEQIHSSSDVDERADVFSIGVILYELVVARRFYLSSGDIMQDVKARAADDAPRPRSVNRSIDKDLEAIILKAIHADTNCRYRSAQQLAQDIANYQSGLPVSATAPTLLYGVRKYITRHKTPALLSSAIVFLLLLLVGGVFYLHYQSWGRWVPVVEADFTRGRYNSEDFELTHYLGATKAPLVVDSAGLRLPWGNWCWLSRARVAENVRVVIDFRYGDIADGFEIVINGDSTRSANFNKVPRSYSCQVGGFMGGIDFVSVNKHAAVPSRTQSRPSAVSSEQRVRVVFQRIDNTIELIVNGRRQLRIVDAMPFRGEPFSSIGFHTYAKEVQVQRLSVYHLSLPRHASPLVAAEAFMSKGLYSDALALFLALAEDFSGRHVAQQALRGAFLAAHTLGDTVAVDSILGVLRQRYPRSVYWQDIEERRMIALWRSAQFSQVLYMLPYHYARWPNTMVALELDRLTEQTSPERESLLPWLFKTRGVTWLNLSGVCKDVLAQMRLFSEVRMMTAEECALEQLTPLQGLKLYSLEVANNRLSSLQGLEGMPLSHIRLEHNAISSLQPLAKAPLVHITAEFNKLTALPQFTSGMLKRLHVDGNQISSLKPLAGQGLRYLSIADNPVSSLEPLRGMGLHFLRADRCPVQDFFPLRGMPLTTFSCEGCSSATLRSVLPTLALQHTTLSDCALGSLEYLQTSRLDILYVENNGLENLEPLVGSPLRILSCSSNRIASLEPLRSSKLEFIDCSKNNIHTLEPLAQLQLNTLDCSFNPLTSLGPLLKNPPATFYFYLPSLPPDSLDAAIALWERSEQTAHHARNGRIIQALLASDAKALQQFALQYRGHSYLMLPLRLGFEESLRLCERLQGHVVTLGDKEEQDVVLKLYAKVFSAWLGVVSRDGTPGWVTGEPFDFMHRLDYKFYDSPCVMNFGGIIKKSEDTDKAAVLIEWDQALERATP